MNHHANMGFINNTVECGHEYVAGFPHATTTAVSSAVLRSGACSWVFRATFGAR